MNSIELRRAFLSPRQERAIAKNISREVLQVRGQVLVSEEVITGIGRLTDLSISEAILLAEKQVAASKITGAVADSDIAFLKSAGILAMAQVITRTAQVLMP